MKIHNRTLISSAFLMDLNGYAHASRRRARVKEKQMKSAKYWDVDGVHAGKTMSALPITYLLWFVGSPVMRRVRWEQCRIAIGELRRRLLEAPESVESDLITNLQPKSINERSEMLMRRKTYRESRT